MAISFRAMPPLISLIFRCRQFFIAFRAAVAMPDVCRLRCADDTLTRHYFTPTAFTPRQDTYAISADAQRHFMLRHAFPSPLRYDAAACCRAITALNTARHDDARSMRDTAQHAAQR